MENDQNVVEDIYQRLRLLDGFADVAPDAIHVDTLQTLPHSKVYRLRVGSQSFILKRPGVADVAGLAVRECRFYRHIAPRLPGGLVPCCVLAVDDEQGGWLMIEDLAGSHRPVGDSSKPTFDECRGLVTSLATLHGLSGMDDSIRAAWIETAGQLSSADIDQRVEFFLTALGPFLGAVRDRVDVEILRFLSDLERISGPLSQAATQLPQVLVHGDAHFGNALYADASACLIDWGMPMLAFGEIDLAHVMALNLPRKMALEWEAEIIRIYLEQRSAIGAPQDADLFREGYRLGVLYSLISPVVWWRSGVPESTWWPALTNAIGAARDIALMD